jgi:hypothetical protein
MEADRQRMDTGQPDIKAKKKEWKLTDRGWTVRYKG